MQKCLLKKYNGTVKEYCMLSFMLKVFLKRKQEIQDFDVVITRFEKDPKMKMYDLCYWLSGRNIKYKLSFKYNKNKSLKWNIKKYINYIRLKVRVKEITQNI